MCQINGPRHTHQQHPIQQSWQMHTGPNTGTHCTSPSMHSVPLPHHRVTWHRSVRKVGHQARDCSNTWPPLIISLPPSGKRRRWPSKYLPIRHHQHQQGNVLFQWLSYAWRFPKLPTQFQTSGIFQDFCQKVWSSKIHPIPGTVFLGKWVSLR